ncbi:MAG: phenylacetate-CoA oxygenase subunit PaaC [Ignavibacteriae bacterium]|nr:phenylacetate-CoA oxygenase subunit PaaC [Ignavibacteriota bacterium]
MNEALKNLLYRMADDELIIGHRNSEWTGLGPILEEDIAFSSIAQDKIVHSLALFKILESLGEPEPDTSAFMRNSLQMKCCHLVEYPIGGYDFSLIRHFLFDTAEMLRYQMLEDSSYLPLSLLAKKVRGEIKYHVFHANTWVAQLGAQGNEDSHSRMQSALNLAFPLALGIFEPSEFEKELKNDGIFGGETELQKRWLEAISITLQKATLILPQIETVVPSYGGRTGSHTDLRMLSLLSITIFHGILIVLPKQDFSH